MAHNKNCIEVLPRPISYRLYHKVHISYSIADAARSSVNAVAVPLTCLLKPSFSFRAIDLYSVHILYSIPHLSPFW